MSVSSPTPAVRIGDQIDQLESALSAAASASSRSAVVKIASFDSSSFAR